MLARLREVIQQRDTLKISKEFQRSQLDKAFSQLNTVPDTAGECDVAAGIRKTQDRLKQVQHELDCTRDAQTRQADALEQIANAVGVKTRTLAEVVAGAKLMRSENAELLKINKELGQSYSAIPALERADYKRSIENLYEGNKSLAAKTDKLTAALKKANDRADTAERKLKICQPSVHEAHNILTEMGVPIGGTVSVRLRIVRDRLTNLRAKITELL